MSIQLEKIHDILRKAYLDSKAIFDTIEIKDDDEYMSEKEESTQDMYIALLAWFEDFKENE